MNEALINLGLFVRDLLTHSEQLIRIGRLNYEIDDFTDNYIAIDTIGSTKRIASGQSFDEDNEDMEYQEQYLMPVVLSFYGTNAYANATKFSLYLQSQNSIELQESLGIAVFKTSTLIDVEILTGQEFNNRVDMSFNVQYYINVDIETLRIDTARTTLLTN